MILTKRDLGEFESALEKCYSRRRLRQNEFGAYFAGHERDLQFTAWLAQNPQVLMAGGETAGVRGCSHIAALPNSGSTIRDESGI
jgi:hypothetical protein